MLLWLWSAVGVFEGFVGEVLVDVSVGWSGFVAVDGEHEAGVGEDAVEHGVGRFPDGGAAVDVVDAERVFVPESMMVSACRLEVSSVGGPEVGPFLAMVEVAGGGGLAASGCAA